MHCWSCEAELLEDSNFCHKCGARVRGEHQPSATPGEREASPVEDASPGGPSEEPALVPAPASLNGPLVEKEVWVGRPNIWSLAGRLTFAGLCLLGTVAGVLFLSNRRPGLVGFLWAVAAAFLIIVGVWLLVSIIKTKLTLKYRLTTERLSVERGFLGKRSEEMELLRVDDVTVHQGVFDRLANVGNIVITSTEPTDPLYIIVGAKHPFELKEKVRQHARELRRHSLRPG